MAMTFGAMYTMCEFSFSKAYSPYLQKRLSTLTLDNEKSEKRKLVNQAYGFGAIFVLLYFVLVGVCWFLINYIVDSKYLPCFEFIPWILMACTIHVFYSLTIEYIYTAKKTLGLGIITFSGSLAQFLMTFTFVNLWGQNGIKYSIVLGNLIIMVGVWWYSNRVYPMPWFRKMS